MRGLALTISTVVAMSSRKRRQPRISPGRHRVPAPPSPRIAKDERSDGGLRIVVVGESSAEGVPYRDWLSVGKIVAWQLRRALPWRIVPRGGPGEAGLDPGADAPAARRVADAGPTLVIVYAGHNEFASRFGWSSDVPYYRDDPAAAGQRFADPRRSRRWPGSSASCTRRHWSRRPPRGSSVGSSMSRRTRRPQYAERLADFRRRLEGIVAYCEAVGALPVLVIPPGNDAGFEPNRSVLPPETPRPTRGAFAREVEAARRLEATDPSRASGAIAS